jgi:rhodanese-related sulfurtransferase
MDRFLEFANNNMLLVFGLVVSFLVLIFSELRRKATGLINIEAVEAVRLINDDAAIIDIRNADAFARGHIVNARNIPYDELGAKSEQLDKWKSKTIIAVCDAGITTNRAVNSLRKAGFENVFGLKGGMNGWSQAGLPVVTGKKTKSKK